jgi:hypothetical protein
MPALPTDLRYNNTATTFAIPSLAHGNDWSGLAESVLATRLENVYQWLANPQLTISSDSFAQALTFIAFCRKHLARKLLEQKTPTANKFSALLHTILGKFFLVKTFDSQLRENFYHFIDLFYLVKNNEEVLIEQVASVLKKILAASQETNSNNQLITHFAQLLNEKIIPNMKHAYSLENTIVQLITACQQLDANAHLQSIKDLFYTAGFFYSQLQTVRREMVNSNDFFAAKQKNIVQHILKLLEKASFSAQGMALFTRFTQACQAASDGNCIQQIISDCLNSRVNATLCRSPLSTTIAYSKHSTTPLPLTQDTAIHFTLAETSAAPFMHESLTNATLTLSSLNSTSLAPSTELLPSYPSMRFAIESGVGALQGLSLFAIDKLSEKFVGKNPSLAKKIPGIFFKSLMNSSINLARYPIAGPIAQPIVIDSTLESLTIYFASNLVFSTSIPLFIYSLQSWIEKFSGPAYVPQLINFILCLQTLSLLFMSEDFQNDPTQASLGLALNWLTQIAVYSLLNGCFPQKQTRLTASDSQEAIMGMPLISIDNSNRNSDSSSCSSLRHYYFITQENLSQIRENLAAIKNNLRAMRDCYTPGRLALEQATKTTQYSSISQILFPILQYETDKKINLIDESIQQISSYQELLNEQDHNLACHAFSSVQELLNNSAVRGLHALLKEIKRILQDDQKNSVSSTLNKIETATDKPGTDIYTKFNAINTSLHSVISLIKVTFSTYEAKQQGSNAEKTRIATNNTVMLFKSNEAYRKSCPAISSTTSHTNPTVTSLNC